MNALLEQFLIEAREFVLELNGALLSLEKDPGDAEQIALAFRLFHTLKGNSGLFEFTTMTQLLHVTEDLLDKVRSGELALDTQLIDLLLQVMDVLQLMLDDIERDHRLDWQAQEVATLIHALKSNQQIAANDLPTEHKVSSVRQQNMNWLAKLSDATRLQLFLQEPAHLRMVKYQPVSDCFFMGDDPLRTAMTTPGLLALTTTPRQPWPSAEMMDIYSCQLDFYCLTESSEQEITQHYLYVADQVQQAEVPRWALAIPTGISQQSDAYIDFLQDAMQALGTPAQADLMAGAESLLTMLNSQLYLASALRWFVHCLQAGAPGRVLAALLQSAIDGQPPVWHHILEHTEAQTLSATQPQSDQEILALSVMHAQLAMLALPAESLLPGHVQSVLATLAAISQSMSWPITEQLRQMITAPENLSELPALLASIKHNRGMSSFSTVQSADSSETSDTKHAGAAAEEDSTAQTNLIDMLTDRRRDDVHDKVRVLKVSQEKVDAMLDVVGELVVAKNALPYLISKADQLSENRDLVKELKAYSAVLHRLSEELRDSVMQIRMLPVGSVFQRFPRLVRDVAKKLGKEVELRIEGESTEADKQIVECLTDPLVHILRNSLDHGLETPEVRRHCGKQPQGLLQIRAFQEGDRVLITIEDDGKGIDTQRVKQKALQKGLIDEQRALSISDEDAHQLVFLPGFSTAEAISDLSGRGVGMDVVRTSLERVGGTVKLSSQAGKGTLTVLSLPLSVSVSTVMLLNIDQQLFGVPLDMIAETVRIPQTRIHQMGTQRTTVLRDKLVPLYSAHQLLGLNCAEQVNPDGEISVLIAKSGTELFGLIVDGFSQTLDLLTKPLDGMLAGLSGYSGTALLGDGSVLLVLDVKELIQCL